MDARETIDRMDAGPPTPTGPLAASLGRVSRLSLLLVAMVAASFATSPRAEAQNKAKATLNVRADGDDVKVAISIALDPGWHIYHGPTAADMGPPEAVGMPTTITMIGDGFEWSAPRFPEPEREEQVFGETKTWILEHSGTPVIFLRGKKSSPTADAEKLQAKLSGLTCDPSGCVPYGETVDNAGKGPERLFKSFPADLVVGAVAKAPGQEEQGGAGGVEASGGATVADQAGHDTEVGAGVGGEQSGSGGSSTGQLVSPEELRKMGFAGFLWTAVLYGLLALLMPCTYPMIPITISYFTKQATTRQASLPSLALCYGVGIVAMFAAIGVLFGAVIQKIAFHWATNLFFALVFVLFALSMIGVFLLQPPQFLMRLSTSATKRGGYGGVFLMGATLVITSFTCTTPFVGSLLAIGADVEGGGRGRVALGMAVFGLTMAVPFVLLALLPGRVKALPKGGGWTHTLKVTLGFLELAAAIKFFSNVDIGLQAGVFPRELFFALVGGVFVLTALYLFGVIRLDEEVEAVVLAPGTPVKLHSSVSPKRLTAGIAFFLFGVYCGYGALGNKMDGVMTSLAPPYHAYLLGGGSGLETGAASAKPEIVKDDLDAACALAERQGKLVLINFTGFQ